MLDAGPVPLVSGLLASVAMFAIDLFVRGAGADRSRLFSCMMVMFALFAARLSTFWHWLYECLPHPIFFVCYHFAARSKQYG